MLSPKPWKPERVIWLFASLLACLALGTLVVQGYLWAMSSDDSKASPNAWIMLMGTMLSHGMALVLVWVFLREHQLTWREAFGFKTDRLPRTLLLAVLTSILVLPIAWSLASLCENILIHFAGKATPQQAVVIVRQAVSLPEKIYFGVMAILLAPIVEEIIFRGVLYPAIRQFGYYKTAAWASSILFAWSHFNLMTFVPLLFLGFVLTLLYETTDNLSGPILAHSLFNATNYFWLLRQMNP